MMCNLTVILRFELFPVELNAPAPPTVSVFDRAKVTTLPCEIYDAVAKLQDLNLIGQQSDGA